VLFPNFDGVATVLALLVVWPLDHAVVDMLEVHLDEHPLVDWRCLIETICGWYHVALLGTGHNLEQRSYLMRAVWAVPTGSDVPIPSVSFRLFPKGVLLKHLLSGDPLNRLARRRIL